MVKKVHKKKLTDSDLKAAGVSKKPVVRKIRRPHHTAEEVDKLKAQARKEGRLAVINSLLRHLQELKEKEAS